MSHGRICPAARGRLRLCRFGFGRGGGGGGVGCGGGEAVGRWKEGSASMVADSGGFSPLFLCTNFGAAFAVF